MKKSLMFALLLGLVSVTYASNKIAIDYYDAGDYATAKSYFLNGNIDAMDSYYLGKIYLITNKKDSAEFYFNKGLQLYPANAYNKVGLATLSNDTKALSAIAGDKMFKKDPQMLIAVAQAFAFNNNQQQVDNYVARAKKADKRHPLPFIFEGDQFLAQKKTNEAASKYENALYFDPNSKIALLKLSQIYENVRTQVAVDYLNKAIELDPQYAVGLASLGDLSYRKGFYPQALDAYNKYFNVIKPSPADYERYVAILYFNKKYDQALDAISKASDTFVMNRLKMYSLTELGKYDEALAAGQKFFNMVNSTDIIAQDLTTYADLLSRNKQYAEAATYFNRAYKLDTTKVDILKDLAKTYENAKDYGNATICYQTLASKPEAALSDIFMLGRLYYIAGNDETITDAALKATYLTQADNTFKTVVERMPDNYMGYFWRARTNTALDPELTQGLAKPYYEKALELMLPQKDERKGEIIEAYRYLGYYYYVKNDMAQAKSTFNKILELDPTNETALQVIKNIDTPKRPAGNRK